MIKVSSRAAQPLDGSCTLRALSRLRLAAPWTIQAASLVLQDYCRRPWDFKPLNHRSSQSLQPGLRVWFLYRSINNSRSIAVFPDVPSHDEDTEEKSKPFLYFIWVILLFHPCCRHLYFKMTLQLVMRMWDGEPKRPSCSQVVAVLRDW